MRGLIMCYSNVLDNAKYFEFVDKARAMGITVPIIPGIKPIAVQRHYKYCLNFESTCLKI
jgi:5,10-methylenetetrahydrofolate reductase